jgi:DNA-binding NarL/FixJ family response regulator
MTMKILLVDDHVLFREGLASLLTTQADIEVVGGANNVEEAIEYSRKFKPDLILMDFGLPDGTGVEATQSILAERPETSIVFLTVHEDDQHLFAGIRSGAKGYLPKSIPIVELLAYLRRVERGDMAVTPQLADQILRRFSRTRPRPAVSSSAVAKLTSREIEILLELEAGYTNNEIARRLFISERTVKNHVGHILSKLDLKDRYKAAEFARQNGLTDG